MKSEASWINYALLIGLAMVLGANFAMTKVAVVVLPPGLVVASRLAMAALVLTLLMLAARQWFPPLGKVWWYISASALFGHTLPFSLLSWSQQKMDAGLTAILMATMPLFTLLLAQLFTRDEKPNRYAITGFAIALVGIIVLFGPDKLASLADQSLRQYAAMLAAMSYGVNAIVTKGLTGLAWQQTSATFMIMAFIMSLPWLLMTDLSSVSTDYSVWMAVAYSGLMATAFAAVIIIFIVRRAGASFLSQINFLIPVLGVGFAIVLTGEVLPPNGAIALVIILTGVALARWRPQRKIISINKGV